MEAFYSGSIRFQLYDTVQNFDELIDGLNETIGAFPDWHWEVLEVLFDGDLVTARYADTGTHMGLFQGIEPTGLKVLAAYRVIDDRIVEMWSSLNIRDVIGQIA